MTISLNKFQAAYIECALWSSTGDEGDTLDNYNVGDFFVASLTEMLNDCNDFQETNKALLDGLDVEQCGHDFWLTRNGHGAGFWDRGLGKVGDELTEMCEAYGSCDIVEGDDGKLYI